MTRQILHMKWTVIFSIALGYLLSTSAIGTGALLGIYDSLWPVVTMQGTLIEKGDGFAVVHISGTKHRKCQFLQIDSYATNQEGMIRDANETALGDVPYDGGSKPPGSFDLGQWRIFPIDKRAVSLQMYVEHSCDGRMVITKIVEVPL